MGVPSNLPIGYLDAPEFCLSVQPHFHAVVGDVVDMAAGFIGKSSPVRWGHRE